MEEKEQRRGGEKEEDEKEGEGKIRRKDKQGMIGGEEGTRKRR